MSLFRIAWLDTFWTDLVSVRIVRLCCNNKQTKPPNFSNFKTIKYILLIVHIHFRWAEGGNHHHLGTPADRAATTVNLEGLAPTTNYSSLEMSLVIFPRNSGYKYLYGPNLSWEDRQGRQSEISSKQLYWLPKREKTCRCCIRWLEPGGL